VVVLVGGGGNGGMIRLGATTGMKSLTDVEDEFLDYPSGLVFP
jgi:hypothetical protein